MIESLEIILTLIERYDYGGAYDLLTKDSLEHTDVGKIINSCRYAINFDFKTAKRNLYDLSPEVDEMKLVIELRESLDNLIRGNPEDMFSELIENIKFQIVNEEYIDFLGRVYRFKEALFKYIFVKENIDGKKIRFINEMMSKRIIMKQLRKKYKIFNSNIVYGISNYIGKFQKDNHNYQLILKRLNSQKMDALIELRHESIVGHGFAGVSIDDIYRIYGNPYNVVDDFEEALEIIGIRYRHSKYARINELLYLKLHEANGIDTRIG